MKKCIVLVGTSGSGKNTLAKELEIHGYTKLVTSTTREIREKETKDVDYHFVQEIIPEEFVEWIEYAGNRYGLSKKEVKEKIEAFEKVYVILNIDGCRVLKQMVPETKSIGLYLTKDKLIERLRIRKESEETIQKRLIQYEKEKNDYLETDYIIDANKGEKECVEQLNRILKCI